MEKAVVAAKTPSSTGRKSKSTTGEETPGSVRKTKSFKRIRGFLSGESRKERRERKARKRAASAAATPASTASRDGRGGALPAESEDDESFYDVDLEDRSIASSVATPVRKKKAQSSLLPQEKTEEEAMEDHEAFFSSSEFKKPYLLKVVLLLMDPKTRRFELLQLEFDSLKALVSDVLAQVPVSVTEDALRKQTYTGICGHAGKEMTREKLLATFCHGNDVLVAVPTGTSSKEVARLAKPILGDDKVGAMVRDNNRDELFTRTYSVVIRLYVSHFKSSLCHICSSCPVALTPRLGKTRNQKRKRRLPLIPQRRQQGVLPQKRTF
jgi:hypothetical protein